MCFYTHLKWKTLFLFFFAVAPLCKTAQVPLADVPHFSYYRHLAPPLDDNREDSPPATDTDPNDSVRHDQPRSEHFQWKPALREYLLEISIQHGWRFVHEKGTVDATGTGPWFHDWMNSIGETRGWDDGDGWHASYVGHPLNGGIYGFIEQQNDPLYRNVQWGDGRIYWISRLRALAFSALASTQWTLGPLSEASLGNVQLHSSPGFIDLVQTPTLGVMEMMGEDLIDRYFILPLENRTANPWLLLAVRSLGNPARSFAALMAFRYGWDRPDRPGLFGENHQLRKELLAEYHKGLTGAPFRPHSAEEKALMNQTLESLHPDIAPIELQAYALYEGFLNGHNCFGGGGQGAVRMAPALQIVSEVNGCMIVGTPTNESADSVTFSVGPRWTPLPTHRFSPFLQMLFGGRRVSYEIQNPELRETLKNEWNEGLIAHDPKRSDYQVQYQALGFDLTMGGGFDAAFGHAFAWRVLDLNYSHSWLPDVHSINTSNGVRVTTGVVLRLGNW